MAKEYKSLTVKDIKKVIDEVFNKNKKPRFIFWQYCKTVNGAVERTENNLNICGNPDCHNCMAMAKAFEDSFKIPEH
jgi:hypothetical protein